MAATALGLWGSLFAGAIWMGWGESIVQTAIARDLAHIQIHKPGYQENKETANFIPGGMRVLQAVREKAGVQAASGRTLLEGMAASPESTAGVKIVGIDPAYARKTTDIAERLVDGDYFTNRARNPICIGQKLAVRLGLKHHSKIVISFQALDGTLIYAAFKIEGIFKTESSSFDKQNVFVRQTDLFRIMNSEPFIHEIAVRLEMSRRLAQAEEDLKAAFPRLSVQTWKEIAPEVAITSASMESFTYLFLVIILFALIFGITNTMLMAVMERMRELGILIAVGMKKRKILAMILLETLWLSITGGIIGIILGGLTISHFSHAGINFSIVASGLESFGAAVVIFPFLPMNMYLSLPVMIVIAAGLSALLPVWKAVHIQPSKTIKIS